MPYATRYRERAKRELEHFTGPYDEEFRQALHSWLNQLAAEAQGKNYSLSIDALDLLNAVEEGADPGDWPGAWKRWKEASWRDKLRALLVILRKRRPPWEFRGAVQTFPVLSGAFHCEVHALYEVAHVDRQVIFTKFTGLPGQ
jgi:hypothetical protein